jgi:hypothetical protein
VTPSEIAVDELGPTDTTGRERRRASITLACRDCCNGAADRVELLRWLDMLGLPPCERPLRTSVASHRQFAGYLNGAKPC